MSWPSYFGAGSRSTGEGALFARSLEVLARPELHLRVRSVVPGEPDARLDLYLSQDAACLGYFDEQGFCVGAPVSRSMLVGALARRLRCASLPPGVETEAAATAGQVRLLSLVWSRAGRAAAEPVSEREAVEVLTRASMPERDAADALRALREAGAVIQDKGELRLPLALGRALAALWSGHRVELEMRRLARIRVAIAPGHRPAIASRCLRAREMNSDAGSDSGRVAEPISAASRW